MFEKPEDKHRIKRLFTALHKAHHKITAND